MCRWLKQGCLPTGLAREQFAFEFLLVFSALPELCWKMTPYLFLGDAFAPTTEERVVDTYLQVQVSHGRNTSNFGHRGSRRAVDEHFGALWLQ